MVEEKPGKLSSAFEVGLAGLDYLAEVKATHDVCTASLKIVGHSPESVELFRAALFMKNQFRPEKVKSITTRVVERVIEEARRAEQDGFAVLCRHTLVALCGGLENLVKDVVAATLLDEPALVYELPQRTVRLSAAEVMTKSDDERARLLVDVLYREENSSSGVGERLRRLLLHIRKPRPVKLTEDVVAVVDEAFEVRNAIVHRGARIDARLGAKVTRMRPKVGEPLALNQEALRRYSDAIIDFAGEVAIGRDQL